MKKHSLSPVAFGLKTILFSGLAAGLFSSGASAQNAPAVEADVERISVVGSRRNDRTVAESNVPVDVINLDQMLSTGQLETSQILANLTPSFNFPQATIADGTDHSRPAVLRGLAPDHTLVLINGKRRHAGALLNLNGTVGRGSSAVDLNMIPSSAIKRIEILRDGAASQYGSDAIAGVINIVLKDGAEGGSMSATYGKYVTEMAGSPELESVGTDADGNLSFNEGGDRERTDGAAFTLSGDIGFSLGQEGFLHLAYEMSDRDPTDRTGYDTREQYARLDDGSDNGVLDPREFTFDRYNHRFGKPEVRDDNFFYNLGYQLTPDTEFYSFGSYSLREGEGAGFYRRANDSRNVPEIYPNGFLPMIASDIKDHSWTLGLKGVFWDWDWDTSLTTGRDDFNFRVENSVNTSLGADSPVSFDAGSLIYRQTVFNFDMSRVFDVSFLPNSLLVAFGTEYRDESYVIKAGEYASYVTVLDDDGNPVGAGGAQVFSGFSPDSAVNRGRHNVAAYFELDTDLVDEWNVTVAGRFEDYSDFGNNFSAKFATRYELLDNLAVRGSVSSGFRAPSLAQSYYTSIATVFEDGVPNEVGLFPADNPAAEALGAEPLEAEESVNYSIGLTFQPAENWNITLDVYRIDIDDRIVLSENLSGDEVEAILVGQGILNTQRVRYFTNAIDTETKGFDFVTSYDLMLDDLGELRLSAAYNKNETEVTHIDDNPTELAALGDDYVAFSDREVGRFERATPDTKLNLSAVWNLDDWQVTLRSTRYGEVVDVSSNPENDEVLEPKWITDLDVNYAVTDSLKVSLGANNLFDQYPQATIDNIGESTFNRVFPYSGFSAYSLDGRFVYAKLAWSF